MYLASAFLGGLVFVQAGVGADRVMPTADPSPPAVLEPIPDARVQQAASAAAGSAAVKSDRPGASLPSVVRPAQEAPKEASAVASGEGPPAVTPTAPRRPLPPDMVAKALTLPEGSKVSGRGLTLLEALSSAVERSQRLAVVRAYWRLSQEVAQYVCCFWELQRINEFQARAEDAALWRAARSSAQAALDAAEVAVVAAQHELAEAAAMRSGEPLPLPADLPHVGPYRTHYDEVAARQPLPAHARLIDRRLPIRRSAIDIWASAVQAADDALLAIVEAYRRGEADLPTVLEYAGQAARHRRQLIAAVCQYNDDIAQYALAVAGPETTGPALVAMLIKTSRPPASPSAPASSGGAGLPKGASAGAPQDSAVQPATLNELVPAESAGVSPATTAGQGTPAIPRDALPRAGRPTLAPPRPSKELEKPSGETAPSEPAEAARDARAEPLVPVRPTESSAEPRLANRPTLGDQTTAPLGAGLYPGLVDVKPAVRAQRLADAICWNRSLGSSAGRSVELKDLLIEAKSPDRAGIIDAYWLARQRVAEYQVLVMHNDWLEELVPVALERRSRPGGPEEMLRLQAARVAGKALQLEVQLKLLEAQFELTRRSGLSLSASWLLPGTTPHSGPYLLNLEAQASAVANSWKVQRLARTIPALWGGLEQRANAVVEADSARAAATAAYQSGTRTIDYALAAINRQTAETQAFLETLTAYNRSIAAYVLSVVPAAVPAERLVEALVVMK